MLKISVINNPIRYECKVNFFLITKYKAIKTIIILEYVVIWKKINNTEKL